MKKVLFVCHGNICRSPMAEFVMKDLVEKAGLSGQFEIASAAHKQPRKSTTRSIRLSGANWLSMVSAVQARPPGR